MTHVVQPYGYETYHIWLFARFHVRKQFGWHLPRVGSYTMLGRAMARGFR